MILRDFQHDSANPAGCLCRGCILDRMALRDSNQEIRENKHDTVYADFILAIIAAVLLIALIWSCIRLAVMI